MSKKCKVKILCRNPDDYMRETKNDIHKAPRNYDPSLHPFEVPREYTRAMNAVKIQRIFAKPFLASLDGHKDGVSAMMKHPTALSLIVSGACDGEIRFWNMVQKKCIRTVQAHSGMVRGLCAPKNGSYFYSVSDDKTIRQWNLETPSFGDSEEPLNTIIAKTVLTGTDHHWKDNIFATCGDRLDIWEETRTAPLRSITWGVDSLHSVKFNPIEVNLLCTTASDRGIILYDIREASPVRKVVLEMRSNTISWNPMEAFIFTAANEDSNLYSFDLRNFKKAFQVHRDHVGAVIDIDYSPTGREIASGSYDKTIRIFPLDKSNSREIYHTKRMQRLSSVLWSADNKYIISGSDEMNIRMWKATAWEKLGPVGHRERTAVEYNEKLKRKFSFHPKVRAIANHRHVPKHVLSAKLERKSMASSAKRKEDNRRAHSKKGTVPFTSYKSKQIVREDE